MSPVNFAIYPFPFGFLRIDYEGDTIIFFDKVDQAECHGQRTEWSDKAYQELIDYLEGKRKDFSFKYKLNGTDFQQKVWRALSEIPYGETRTYKEIAIAIGQPNATRAVGNANNKNPMIVVIPCHRVIGSDGKLIGYAGGLEMKKALLRLEAEHSEILR
ncbi:methylated-DNA--[protein]-cysteine S-methyltransferase [Pelistega suis]|uniref:methylated-DNA--[protein]-cysteine S-methyltransferase n=1 Tax=Pelistega suis TaxID=1631957 RepID=UPI00211C9E3F|nr:methylated-DNA--[protein]-cysteine S-methyltransferase [Pelistega suis]MCQ9328572.1 methylated-DNA--[protein]-cysteine S-methyltransferase [Pelistega suis]